MAKTLSQGLANVLGSPVCREADFIDADGNKASFLIFVPANIEQIDTKKINDLLKVHDPKDAEPTAVCLARSIGDWVDAFAANSELRLAETVDEQRQSAACYAPRRPKLLKRGDKQGSLVFCAGEELYSEIGSHLDFAGSVYAIDNSFVFFSLTKAFNAADLASRFTPEVFARQYLHSLEAVNAKGPFYIAGFSYGGTMALELARILKRAGKEVKLVMMFDTITPESARTVPKAVRLKRHLKKLLQEGIPHLTRSFKNIAARYDLGKSLGVLKPAGLYIRQVYLDRDLVRMFHRSSPYDGKVVLFRSNSEAPYLPVAHDYGWREYLSDLEVVKVASEHEEFVGANTKLLKSEIETRIKNQQ